MIKIISGIVLFTASRFSDLRTNVKTSTPRQQISVTPHSVQSSPIIINNFNKKNLNGGSINGIAAIAAAAAALSNGSIGSKSPLPQMGSTIAPILTQVQKPLITPQQQQQQQQHQLMSDVSDMLYEFYKSNAAKAPKTIKLEKPRQQSPSSADGAATIVTSTPILTIIPTKQQQNKDSEPTSTTSIMASKNVNGDEMAANKELAKKLNAPFHPRIKYSNLNNKQVANTPTPPPIPTTNGNNQQSVITSSPTTTNIVTTASVVTPKPPIIVVPSTVIQSPSALNLPTAPAAAALAAALFRDGYQNFTQQIRAQEQLLKQQRDASKTDTAVGPPQFPPKYMNNFLRKDSRYSENDDQSSSDEREDDEEDEHHKYPEIDDIHLIEGSKSGAAGNVSGGTNNFSNSDQLSISMDTDYMSDESHKYSMIAAHALRNLEYSLDFNNGVNNQSGGEGSEESSYNCRHCGKKYRWKSTLRRHENVECGGKEPSHQCPYCPYKSKQRGNLGVHVRKHHANLPQLASKRRSKYSQPPRE